MFQFRRFPLTTYVFSCKYMEMTPCRFPHSEIPGSKVICTSPRLIAACHVLLRLPVPRHSPCALFSLTNYLWILILLEKCWNCLYTNKLVTHNFSHFCLLSQCLYFYSVFKEHFLLRKKSVCYASGILVAILTCLNHRREVMPHFVRQKRVWWA